MRHMPTERQPPASVRGQGTAHGPTPARRDKTSVIIQSASDDAIGKLMQIHSPRVLRRSFASYILTKSQGASGGFWQITSWPAFSLRRRCYPLDKGTDCDSA